LECLFNYKHSYITPYKETLRKLLSEDSLHETLMTVELDDTNIEIDAESGMYFHNTLVLIDCVQLLLSFNLLIGHHWFQCYLVFYLDVSVHMAQLQRFVHCMW